MNNKEFLNEENYQTGKKKIITLALIILICGILLGGTLITIGIIKSSKIGKSTTDVVEKEDIQSQIDSLENELVSLKAQKNKEFMENSFSEEYYRLDNEISKKEREISNLKEKNWKDENGFNSFDTTFEKSKYIPLYMFGAFIIISTIMVSGYIYMFAKRREILSFTAQQVMPVAQEGMEKMAPTIGKVGKEITKEMAPAYGEVAKEISKGIKEGLNDKEK